MTGRTPPATPCVCRLLGMGTPLIAPEHDQEQEGVPGQAHTLSSLADRLAGVAGLAGLRGQLQRGAYRLTLPTRVAVAGQLKRGKSTLVNALLAQAVAATGDFELTWAVSEFRYARPARLTVHYRDGSCEELPFEWLTRATTRGGQPAEGLRCVARVDCGIDNDLLHRHNFRLIDTPGLNSVYGVDSTNAEEVLLPPGVAEEMAGQSRSEIDQAHAVLFLFHRDLGQQDMRVLQPFLGAGSSVTPLNAFGVLSHCDQFWPPRDGQPAESFDPVRGRGRAVIEDFLHRHAEVGRLLHTMVPVAGLLAQGAYTLPAEQFQWLAGLANGTSPSQWVGWLRDRRRFTAEGREDIPLPAEQRKELVRQLGCWGIFRALHHLRAGIGEAEVRARLVKDSGVDEVRALVVAHFGQRARLVKLDQTLRDVQGKVEEYRRYAAERGVEPDPLVAEVADVLAEMRRAEHGFREIRVLRAFYEGRRGGTGLGFTEVESAELWKVAGETGTGCAARLGLDRNATLGEMVALADHRLVHWKHRSVAPGLSATTRAVAEDVRDCYEWIVQRLWAATQMVG